MFTTDKVSDLLISADIRSRSSDTDDLLGSMLYELERSELQGTVQLWDIKGGNATRVFGPSIELSPDWMSVVSSGELLRLTGERASCCATASRVLEDRMLALVIWGDGSAYVGEAIVELAEVLGDLYRRRLLQQFGEQIDRHENLWRFLTHVYSAEDQKSIYRNLVDDVAEMLECHRIFVFRKSVGHQWTPQAATAVHGIDARSDEILRVVTIIRDAECRIDRAPESFDKQNLTNLVVPLTAGQQWTDAELCVVFQWLPPKPTVSSSRLAAALVSHCSVALRNIERLNSGWVDRTIWKRLRQCRSRSLAFGLGGFACLIALMTLLPWTFMVEVPGIVQPRARLFVFVTEPGVVEEVVVREGKEVLRGDIVCILKNEEFQIQLEEAVGQLAATNARLSAIEAIRADRTQSRPEVLSAESAELQSRSESLQKQIDLLKQRIDNLIVRADQQGTVSGDRIREILPGRPVERGQLICEIVDIRQGWQIDFRIPEAETRHVLRATGQSPLTNQVRYFLESDPGRESVSTITRVGTAAQFDEAGGISTALTTDVDASDNQSLRTGAKAIGWIDCGKRPLGFVLFRRIIEAVRRGWWI